MSTNTESTDPLIGQSIAGGKYLIKRVLGEGGMGKVYEGVQKLGDRERPVAIKTLQPELAQDAQLLNRFLREAGTVGMLEHPNTIKFFESGKLDDGKLFVAMEFIQGESLAHIIARGPLPPSRVEHILSQVCGSLGEAHEHGIIHRDIKPENIILMQKGTKGDFVKVLDFGIAKRDESAEDAAHQKLTRQGMVLGTPPYMSPEQFTGQKLEPMSDIYSLAVVVYEMLTGTLPFTAATPWEWATRHLTAAPTPFEAHPSGAMIPMHQKAAVFRALAKKPEERPRTMQQLLQTFTNNASAGSDWSQATASSAGPFGSMQGGSMQGGSMQGGSMQGGGMYPPTSIPNVATPPPGMSTAPAGSGGVPATMAVNYPQPTPQPFHAQSNPNFVQPGQTGPGFAGMPHPPSNPNFNPVQAPMAPYGGYSSNQGFGQAHAAPSSGAGKYIAIGLGALLLIGGIGTAVALSGDSNSNGGTTPQPTPVPQPIPVPGNNGGMQPVPIPGNNGGMQPIPGNNGGMQPIPGNNGGMQPIPGNNGMQPIPPRPTPPIRVDPPRPAVPSVCRGGGDRIDELILSGRCSAAQSLYRQMRAAGCAPRGAAQSFGTACTAP